MTIKFLHRPLEEIDQLCREAEQNGEKVMIHINTYKTESLVNPDGDSQQQQKKARSRRSDRMKAYYSSPDRRKILSERMKAWWDNSRNKKRLTELQRITGSIRRQQRMAERKAEGNKKKSASMKAVWAIPENKQRITEAMKAGWQRKKEAKKLKLITLHKDNR